jgi:hypothetical protein
MKFASTIIGLTALAASSNAAPTAGSAADFSTDKVFAGLNGTSESQSSHHAAAAMALSDDATILLTPTQPNT